MIYTIIGVFVVVLIIFTTLKVLSNLSKGQKKPSQLNTADQPKYPDTIRKSMLSNDNFENECVISINSFDSDNFNSIKPSKHLQEKTKKSKYAESNIASKKLNNNDPFFDSFIAIDFETANKNLYSACQIGIVVVKDSKIVDKLKYNIQPPNNEYNAWNTTIHGMSSKHTAQSPTFKELWPEIKDIINSNPIVCHNWGTDINVLDQLREYYNIDDMVINNFHCTYDLTKMNLLEASQGFGISLLNHHDGLADALLCAQIYLKLKNGEKINPNLILVNKAGKIERDDKLFNKAINHQTDFFNGKTVVVTGIFGIFEKDDIKEIVTQKGGLIRNSISGKTQIVIQGLESGPVKMEKVNELIKSGKNITIIDEDKFKHIMDIH